MAEPFVDADDIADVAVAALTEDLHIGQIYELTGPRLSPSPRRSPRSPAAAGLEIRYVPVSGEEYAAAAARGRACRADFIDLLTYLFTKVFDGRNAYVTDGVQRALSRTDGKDQ